VSAAPRIIPKITRIFLLPVRPLSQLGAEHGAIVILAWQGRAASATKLKVTAEKGLATIRLKALNPPAYFLLLSPLNFTNFFEQKAECAAIYCGIMNGNSEGSGREVSSSPGDQR
jgi:hypothetical protein